VLVGIQNAAAAGEKRKEKKACIREIQVHKLWTKVYSQKGLTAIHCTHVHPNTSRHACAHAHTLHACTHTPKHINYGDETTGGKIKRTDKF